MFDSPRVVPIFEILRYMVAVSGALAALEELTLRERRMMTPDSCTEFRKAYLVYRCAFNALATQAVADGQCRYLLRPKSHMLGHIAWNYIPHNPRYATNYLDEDFVNKSKRLAEKCHPLYMPTHVLMRYSIAVCLRWSEMADF